MPDKRKRPRDLNQFAASLVADATDEDRDHTSDDDGKTLPRSCHGCREDRPRLDIDRDRSAICC